MRPWRRCKRELHHRVGSMSRALRDLAWLAVLIALGIEFGLLLSHVVDVRGTTWAFAYTGAALLVGFGLINRLLLHTVIRVVGPMGAFGLLIASLVVGEVALPFVVGWRVWTVMYLLFHGLSRFGRTQRDAAKVQALRV